MIRKLALPAVVISLLAGCSHPAPTAAPMPLASPLLDRAMAILQLQATSPDPTVRANCVEAFQVSRDPRGMEIMEQGLHDKEWVVRFAAAMAAGERKAEHVRPVLNTLVVHDPSGSVRAGCIYALHKLGDDTHMSDLAALLGALDYPTKANAALVLGRLGNPTAIPLLQSYRNVDNAPVRFEITAAMARLGDEPSQDIIASWAVSKFADDQWNAMMVCADLPPSVGRSPLLLGLENAPAKLPEKLTESDKVAVEHLTEIRQLVAARSLAKIHDYSGAKIAIDSLKNPEPAIRALAALALGDMLTSREAPALDPMINDPDERVRRATAAAIVKIYARAAGLT
jgi:HEAT repeat protein